MDAIVHDVRALRDDQLTGRLYELRQRERQQQVEFLVHLGELDRRRLFLALGFPSLFAYCTDHLGLSKASAFRRTTAARLLARFPVLAEHLADGRLNLTTLVALRDVLCEERLDEILARAAGRSEEQVTELVAALRPRPAPAEMLRRLPARPAEAGAAPPAGPTTTAAPVETEERTAAAPPRPRLEPISAAQHVVRFTVDEAFVADLRAVRDLLSHQIPDGRLDQVLHHALRVVREQAERRRRGCGRATEATPTSGRYVPAAVRDEVWRRDAGRCTFVGTAGHRCASTHQLELHHIVPFARGGSTTVANLTLHCRQHNHHQAEQDFGAAHVARSITDRQACLF